VDVRYTRKALLMVIHRYTPEAGVRKLEQEIGAICRKIVRKVLKEGKDKTYLVTSKKVPKYLGVPRFKYGVAETHNQVGLVTGLAWTEAGGEMRVTAVTRMPGKGKLIITGGYR